MGKNGENNEESLSVTAQEVLAWADELCNIPAHETAKKLGVCDNTVYKYRANVREFIARDVDLNQYRLPAYRYYGDAMRSLWKLLRKCDTTTTIAYLKGMNIFQEKTGIDMETFNRMTDAELDELEQRLIAGIAERANGSGENSQEAQVSEE
jgi:hypothetical protein